jgi:geranylgeranyl pyrophosphate synthase
VSALAELARQLREEDTPIAPHVIENPESTHDYSLVMEAVREGYLLHYGKSRILTDYDQDLALLAGDYLYALGLDRLAARGDTAAVAVLAELISRCAQFHAEGRGDELDPLWAEAAQKIGAIS